MCELIAVAALAPKPTPYFCCPPFCGGHAGVVTMICGPNNLINVVAHSEETDKEIPELQLIADT